MTTAQTLYEIQLADAPMQLAFRIQPAITVAADYLVPQGALYRVLHVEQESHWDEEEGPFYKVTASAIEFTEANESLCADHFEEWPDDANRKTMERFSFWVSAETDLGERVLNDQEHIDSREALEATLASMGHQARYYARFDPEQDDDAWYQAIANACLKRGDATSTLSLVIRHLV